MKVKLTKFWGRLLVELHEDDTDDEHFDDNAFHLVLLLIAFILLLAFLTLVTVALSEVVAKVR